MRRADPLIIRHGIDQLLPEEVELIHGPGCPVCVTPLEVIDKALEIASRPGVIFCSFGDMLRVPGTGRTCSGSRARAATCASSTRRWTRCGSPGSNPDREVVFFGIGFETTAPPNAMTVHQARKLGIDELQHAGLARARAPGDRGDHAARRAAGCRASSRPVTCAA